MILHRLPGMFFCAAGPEAGLFIVLARCLTPEQAIVRICEIEMLFCCWYLVMLCLLVEV